MTGYEIPLVAHEEHSDRPHDKGIVIPLANYALEPIAKLTLQVAIHRPFVKLHFK